MATGSNSTFRRSRPPLWLVEGLDIVRQRRVVLLTVAFIAVIAGVLFTVFAPGIVPPTPLVGAAVGTVALLLGMASAVASDATDLRLRGPRHVSAAGGELVAVLPVDASVEDAAPLAEAVLDARDDESALLLGMAASGRSAKRTAAWTDALARALAARDVSVLYIDLASGRSASPGLVEVVRDGVKLTDAVTFEPGARLALIGAGADQVAAINSLATVPSRLPRDLDVLLVSLPTAASRQVVEAVRSLDHVLIVAERDETARVDLIAGLDALESVGTSAQVALLDDPTAAKLSPRGKSAPATDDQADVEVAGAVADDAGVADAGLADAGVADAGLADAGVAGDAPADDVPTDDVPVVEDAADDASADDVPVDDAPADDVPVDDATLDEAASGEDSVVEEPDGDQPTGDDPGANVADDEQLVAETPVDEVPSDGGSAVDEPTDENPAIAAEPGTTSPVGAHVPAAYAATADESVADVSADEDSVADEPVADEPADEAPADDGPGGVAPADAAPSDRAPVADAPVTAEAADEAPSDDRPIEDSHDNVRQFTPGPGHEPSGPSEDAADGGVVHRREVEVLLGAAEAQAAALTIAESPTVDETDETDSVNEPTEAGAATREQRAAGDVADQRLETPAPVDDVDDQRLQAPASDDDVVGERLDVLGDDAGAADADAPSVRGDATDDDDESTDELPRNKAPLVDPDEQHDDLLTTTARLSMLMDDLEQREQ